MRQLKVLLIDLLLIGLATLCALWLRDNLEFSLTRIGLFLPYLGMTLAIAAVVLPTLRTTRTLWRFSGPADYTRLLLACLLIVLLSISASFALFRLENVSRVLPILQLILMTCFLVGLRMAQRAHRFRHLTPPQVDANAALHSRTETVIVLGLNTVAELFLQAVADHGADRITIAGVIGRHDRQTGQLFRSHKVLGIPEDLEHILQELDVHGVNVDRIVVTIEFDRLSPTAKEALLAIENGTRIKIDYFAERLDFAERPGPTGRSDRRADSPAERSATESPELAAALRNPYWKHKRMIDATLGSITLVLFLPLLVLVAIATLISVGRPIVFWQQRPGSHGRPIRIYKFRTLRSAHDWYGRRLPDKLRETRIGRFLRAKRLDELPQLVNIVTGQMSFVGPRPLLAGDQLDEFRDRLTVRPGLTGWAQVNGGRNVSPSDKMALDMWYIHNASLALDCKIVLLTLRMLLLGERTNRQAVENAWLELSRRG